MEGPLLVIAGAGTGKTRTLVYRVARLVDLGVDPQSILLLTFTRRASEEMLRRASLLIDNRCEKVAGGTFHSFANLVLRQYGRKSGLASAFTIMDRTDSEDVIEMIGQKLPFDLSSLFLLGFLSTQVGIALCTGKFDTLCLGLQLSKNPHGTGPLSQHLAPVTEN